MQGGPFSPDHPLGLIAGNGHFPLLVLREALRQDVSIVVAAIREEASPAIEELAQKSQAAGKSVSLQWLGLGQLGKLVQLFKKSGVQKAVMAGQVNHTRIFSVKHPTRLSAPPDWTMMRLLISLRQKDTASLIGAVAGFLEKNGVELMDSTLLLGTFLPRTGQLTRRSPTAEEAADIRYGRPLARALARLDLGQTIVVKAQAVVAVEAMEGTDETIQRASRLTEGAQLTVIKASRPQREMRFDVPVIGMKTLHVLAECRVSALAVDAGKTLILDLPELVREADRLGITIVAE